MPKTILVLAANPKDTPELRLQEEIREIEAALRRAPRREEFIIKCIWATRPEDIRRAMLDCAPISIVHFCGHGKETEGLMFENDNGRSKLISAEVLAEFFRLFANEVECVVLNACYAETQADAIAQHINYVIGMRGAVANSIAVKFSTAFYDAIGAGKSIESAHEIGCNALEWEDTEQLRPILKSKNVGTTEKTGIQLRSNEAVFVNRKQGHLMIENRATWGFSPES